MTRPCDLPVAERAMAVAKEQVTKATVVAMEQVVMMAVVRAVSWCMRWCGEVRFAGITGRCAEHCSHLWVPPPLTKGTEVCFSNSPECKSLVRAIFGGERGGERCVNKCEND